MKSMKLALIFFICSITINTAHAVCESVSPDVEATTENNRFLQSDIKNKNVTSLQGKIDEINQMLRNPNNQYRDYETCWLQAYTDAIKQIENPQVSASNNANPSAPNTKAQSKESNVNYQAPRGRCLALKVEGDSILVENHCGIPIVGQFCFIHSQLHSCTDSTAASFGPVGAGNEVMIATTTDTNPRSNELKYVLCNADAAEHGQCEPHHP
jgi:hypothetical protein